MCWRAGVSGERLFVKKMESGYALRELLNDNIDCPRIKVFARARADMIGWEIDRFDRDCARHSCARVPLIAF